MGRKKKSGGGSGGEETPAWLITFSDMMTLMLTFFVLLVSMSVVDERRRLVVLGSIIGTFGPGKSFDVMSSEDTRRTLEPGHMDAASTEDLEQLREKVWEDVSEDLDFAANRFVQVFSINEDIMFGPGRHELTPKGRELLEEILPVLVQIEHPLLLAGHTSLLRDELETSYRVEEQEVPDPSWKLSLARVMSIYRFLAELGMDPDKLRVEAFGRHHPRFTSQTAEGRKRNRRVDIVLDKRNERWLSSITPAEKEQQDTGYSFREFRFELKEERPAELEGRPVVPPPAGEP